MPDQGRVLTRPEVEEARKWVLKCYCDDAHTANAVAERLDALARSHEQLRKALNGARAIVGRTRPGETLPASQVKALWDALSAGEETP